MIAPPPGPSFEPHRDPRAAPGRGVYGISVAADLVGMQVQNLRQYEQRGLLRPERTAGGTRRYSDNDLDRLRRIGELLGAGLNIAGIALVLELEADNARLRRELDNSHGPTEGPTDRSQRIPTTPESGE